jgi:hypothetical protein
MGAQIEEAGSVTFSIRELKAVAALLEVLHLPVSLHFDGAGRCVDAVDALCLWPFHDRFTQIVFYDSNPSCLVVPWCSPIIFGSEVDTGAFALDLVLSTLQQDGSAADGTSSSAGCGSGGVDSWSDSRPSPAVGDSRRGGRGHAQPRGGKAARATASFGSGDSIVTADTTPPPSALLHTTDRNSQVSSIPATDRFDLGHGGQGRRIRSFAAASSATRGGHGADEFDSASVGGWAGADCSQASFLSIPSTDRRASVSPREQPTARCLPQGRQHVFPHAQGGQAAAHGSHYQSPDEKQRRAVKRSRTPEQEDQESAADKLDGRVDDIGGHPGQTAVSAAGTGAGAACASEEEEDEFVDATPSPPP